MQSASPYSGYTVESADVNNWIANGPVGANNAWSYSGYSTTWRLCGGDVNTDGDPSDNYVAIEMLNIHPWQPYFMMDEVAIVIY